MNRLLALRLMQETKVCTLLKGYRKQPAADMEKLEEMIILLSRLLIDLERCLAIAQKQGFKTVHGIVLGENRNMLALGKKLGFEINKDPDSSDNNLVIHLGEQNPGPGGN